MSDDLSREFANIVAESVSPIPSEDSHCWFSLDAHETLQYISGCLKSLGAAKKSGDIGGVDRIKMMMALKEIATMLSNNDIVGIDIGHEGDIIPRLNIQTKNPE